MASSVSARNKGIMSNILSIPEALETARQLQKENKKIVVSGGCFDILHIGHISFLEEAKKRGEILFVLLESDTTVKRTKGLDRPIHTQEQRAKILASLRFVDHVVLIPDDFTNQDYDKLVIGLKSAIIATTKGDPGREHKERQARLSKAQVINVIRHIPDTSSSRLVKILSKHFSL